MKRNKYESIFDFTVSSYVLGQFLAVFKGAGFGVSGGVYPYFKDKNGFLVDSSRDLKEGLFSKTIIHPNQIEILNKLYKVTQKEFDEALEIFFNDEVIFNQNGKMAEKTTMTPFAEKIVKRALIYGIVNF